MLRVIDLEAGHVDVERLGNGVRRTAHVERMGDDVDGTAALDSRRLVGIDDVDRDAHPDRRALSEAHEIDMDRQVTHGIELEVARDHPVLLAVDLDVVDAGQEPAGEDALAQFGIVEGDGERRLVATVDDAGHAALATNGPGGPLAGPWAHRRLDVLGGRHVSVLFQSQRKRHPTWRLNVPMLFGA